MYANSHVVCLVEVRFSVHEFAALSCKRICTDANHGSLELQTTRYVILVDMSYKFLI